MTALLAYWPSLVGGMLIGLSAAVLLLANGRIAGISDISARLLAWPHRANLWRMSFIAGLLLGPLVFAAAAGHVPAIHIRASDPLLICAGLLVGVGTRVGSGCTSGHGVCGLARFSPRSFAAVATFLLCAIVTVFVMRHVLTGVP